MSSKERLPVGDERAKRVRSDALVSNGGRGRGHILGLRLDASELDRLDTLAAHYGLTRANVLRMLVKRAHDAVGTDQKNTAKSADPGLRKRRTAVR